MAAINIAKWVLLLTVLVASVQLGESLQCYLCISEVDEHCGNDFDESKAFKIECDPGEDICFKAISPLSGEAFRSCWSKGICRPPYEFCEECETDLCNDGPVSDVK